MRTLRLLAAIAIGIIGFAIALLATPFVIVGALGSLFLTLSETLDGVNRRLTAEPRPKPLDPSLIPPRDAMIQQVETLSAIGARPETIRLALQAIDTLYPPKVH